MASKIIRLGQLELRFHWLVALCVLLTMTGLVRLGLWQLERAEEKVQQQIDYQAMMHDEAWPLANVPLAGREYDAIQLQNRRVLLEGEYLNEQSLFLIYQSFEDQIGYEIVTPFLDTTTNEIVMVSRGWTGAASYEEVRDKLPVIEGTRHLSGQIFVPSAGMAARTNNISTDNIGWPLLIRYLNMEELAPLFDRPLFPYAVRLGEGEPGVLVRHWSTVLVDTSRNFSYALQWFAMAIAVLIVSLVLSSNILSLMRKKLGPI